MKTITIHYTTPYIGTIAKQGEHNQTELVFYLPDRFDDADFVNAEFLKRDGSTSVVDQLIPNNGTVSVTLTQDLTNVDGKMEIQLVAYKVDGTEITEIAKSGIYTGKIRKSLNVLYGEDQPGIIERILAFISYWAEKLPDMLAKKHWHDNKELLDTITPEVLEGEQADWNENNATEKSYVKNRTHWLDDDNEYHQLSNNYLSSEANDAIDKRHTHANKTLLDRLDETEFVTDNYVLGIRKDNDIKYIGFYDVIQTQLPSDPSLPVTFYGNILANVIYRIGTSERPASTITILGLPNMSDGQNNEFVIEFYSGSTATTITLPASVEWADELTVEANKHYQISILNNIALWCAVDVEVSP